VLREEIYEATKRVYALYGAFFGAVAREVGTERALTARAGARGTGPGLRPGRVLPDQGRQGVPHRRRDLAGSTAPGRIIEPVRDRPDQTGAATGAR